jgi:Spy/CpxP family protein refolding chaperone
MKRVITMRSAHVLCALGLGASLSVLAACGGTSAAEAPAATAQSAASKAPVGVGTHGPVKVIGEALGEVPLRPEQRTEIEKLAADSEARHASSKAAHKDLTLAIAAQVEKGSIDRAALKPQFDAAAAAWEGSRPADRAALERLHAILDPQQRAVFIDAVEAKMHPHAAGATGGDEHPYRGHMEEWTTDLKLTDDQKTQIRAALMTAFGGEHHGEHGDTERQAEHQADHPKEHARGEHHEGREHGRKVLEAFKGEKFSLDEVAPAADARAKVGDAGDKFLKGVEVVLPILTAEQRAIAATKLRSHASEAEENAPR